MYTYKITFSVNGARTEQIVKAINQITAENILKAQYPNCKIVIVSCKKI